MGIDSYDILQNANAAQFHQAQGTDELGFSFSRLAHGKSSGVDSVTLNCGKRSATILPTRGMGIWQATNDNIRFGWDSPIDGPVHPMWVPVAEPSGIGWLDGFDEMMVRCGLASNGAPEFEENGNVKWPLHGRIANLPASNVVVDIDSEAGQITIRGTVNENRFHIQRLQLTTEISMKLDSNEISITDTVTNLSNRPSGFQMLYHNNFGKPILEPGSQLFAPFKKLVPRNAHAAGGIETWDQYGKPDPAYEEMVYFLELAADDNNESIVLLANSDQSKGVSIRHDITTLPCFSIWKNTVAESDGYVTGLEPATNFPNPRSFEESQNRVIQLASGESRTIKFHIGLLVDTSSVASVKSKVESLSIENPEIYLEPTRDWCSP